MMDQLDVCCFNYSPNDIECLLMDSKRFESIHVSFHKFDTLQDYATQLDQMERKQIIIVVPSTLAKTIVEKYHDRPCVLSIFLVNTDPEKHDETCKDLCTNKLTKVKNSVENLVAYWEHYQRIHEPIFINAFETNKNGQTSRNIDGGFLHFRRLIDVLLRMPTIDNERTEFITRLRQIHQMDRKNLEIIDRFGKSYRKEDALKWYTRETIIYRDLNLALREQDIEMIKLFAFFIRDLNEQIRSLGQRQSRKTMRLFRGQWMSEIELDRIQKSLGKFISINSFFSTTANSEVASMFSSPIVIAGDSRKQISWIIEINPDMFEYQSFADISQDSHFQDEKEILFTINNIFKVQSIDCIDFQTKIHLVLCDQNNHELTHVYDHLQDDQDDGIFALGDVLRDMGKIDEAARIYSGFQNDQLEADDASRLYHRLGLIEVQRENFSQGIGYFEQALRTMTVYKPMDSAALYINIGNAHESLNNRTLALFCYCKAIQVYQRMSGHAHYLDFSRCFNNIGTLYAYNNEYTEAVDNFTTALKMQLRFYPDCHTDIALSYMNLCNAYVDLGQYDKAIRLYDRSLSLYINSVPSDHPDLIRLYRNMILTFQEMREDARVSAIRETLRAITNQCQPEPDICQPSEH